MSESQALVVFDPDLNLYGSECECGWKSEYLHDDRGMAEDDARCHDCEEDKA